MKFYLNKSTTNSNQHLVHKAFCDLLPSDSSRIELGEHYSCESALEEAKKHFDDSNGCYHCAILCHTKY